MTHNIHYFIDKKKCTRCGSCELVCSGEIVRFDEEGYPYIDPKLQENCMICVQCVCLCPASALQHSEIDPEQCLPIQEELKVSSDQVAQLIKARRSIRNFKPDPVPRDEIMDILDVARYSPTGGHAQAVKYLVVDDRQTLDWITKTAADALIEWSKTDYIPLPANTETLDKDWILWDAPTLVIATADNPNDLSIALAYLDLYAQSKGYGCCWAGYLQFMIEDGPKELNDFFKDMGLNECFYPLMMGVPDERIRYKKIPPRKSADVVFYGPDKNQK